MGLGEGWKGPGSVVWLPLPAGIPSSEGLRNANVPQGLITAADQIGATRSADFLKHGRAKKKNNSLNSTETIFTTTKALSFM